MQLGCVCRLHFSNHQLVIYLVEHAGYEAEVEPREN